MHFFTVVDTNRIDQVYMGENAYIMTETIGGILWQSYPQVTVQENLFENTQDFAVSFHAIERSALKNKGKKLFIFYI